MRFLLVTYKHGSQRVYAVKNDLSYKQLFYRHGKQFTWGRVHDVFNLTFSENWSESIEEIDLQQFIAENFSDLL